jgi:AraC-type DNA-binding domain-containing proteins
MKHVENMRRSIDFIEQHLSEEITLDNLAQLARFSKYHFHRMFKSTIGKPLMEYIRERRLTRAAYELIYSSKTITDIAFDLSFNSQDAFDKAFKRMYGIPPREYRKNMFMKLAKQVSKEHLKMSDLNFYNKIYCNAEEKKECLQLLDLMLFLSKKAHKQGLLSLESEIVEETPFLLQKGLQLIFSGTEPIILREILNNYIYSSNCSGKDFLSAILIKEGLLSIQMGEYPWDIREKLAAFFGMDFSNEIKQHFGVDSENDALKVKNFTETIKDKKAYSEETDLLEKTIDRLDKRSIQRSLREQNIIELAVGMKGASGKTQIKIIESLPKKLLPILLEASELFDIEASNTPQIIDAQNSIVGKIKKLRAEGEIR